MSDNTNNTFAVKIKHNIDEKQFSYLWAMYVRSGNIKHHCARCMNGVWSKKFSKRNNHDLLSQPELIMDEVDVHKYKAIYFCGGHKLGYDHNVHFVVIPKEGATAHWEFENWCVDIENGELSVIPAEADLGEQFFQEPYDEHYYTCRNFRWMLGYFYPELLKSSQHD